MRLLSTAAKSIVCAALLFSVQSSVDAAEPCTIGCAEPGSSCTSIGDSCTTSGCCSKKCSPGTLFQWSYGNSFSGGPNLREPLVTDRPDFTEAASTVGQGVSQFEIGYTYTYDNEDGVSTESNSYGEVLLRQGFFANWLELRVAAFPVDQTVTTGGTSNYTAGTEDLYLGLKIGLTPQEGILPEMAIIPQMTVPSGSNNFTTNETLIGANWIYAWEINDILSCGGSTQANRALDDNGASYTEIAQSLVVGVSLLENVGAYSEWYAFFPHSASSTVDDEHYYNGGFTYLWNDNVQFDIRGGVGLTKASDDYFVGTGVSIRIP